VEHRYQNVCILDFGSQYTQLIARRVREAHVFCEILPGNITYEELERHHPSALILSGGPASLTKPNAPRIDPGILEMSLPILGICYGLQLIAHHFRGKLAAGKQREYGRQEITVREEGDLFFGVPSPFTAWMSHGDHVAQLPPDFTAMAYSVDGVLAGMRHSQRPIFGVQFHPEVHHTPQGPAIFDNFLFRIAGLRGDWTPEDFIAESVAAIREQVGTAHVLLALSGGVDSSVLAFLLHKALGNQLHPVFVDTGLLRAEEVDEVRRSFAQSDLEITFLDRQELFLKHLEGVTDPEQKRSIIGKLFIEVFETEAGRIPNLRFLAQGTLYPDVIESGGTRGTARTIKTHHNVGGLPEKMGLQLLEPFRLLFKDEVRQIGQVLGVPPVILQRHPFPGPGLAVRCLGPVNRERLKILKEADAIFIAALKKSGLYQKVWQAFAVLLPLQTVGVMGDQRTYENVIALRAVTSRDGMTADWARLSADFLADVSRQIVNQVTGVNRVVYDITSKPPGTIEWE